MNHDIYCTNILLITEIYKKLNSIAHSIKIMNLFSDIIRVSFSLPACWYCLLSLLIGQQAGVTFQFCSLLLRFEFELPVLAQDRAFQDVQFLLERVVLLFILFVFCLLGHSFGVFEVYTFLLCSNDCFRLFFHKVSLTLLYLFPFRSQLDQFVVLLFVLLRSVLQFRS